VIVARKLTAAEHVASLGVLAIVLASCDLPRENSAARVPSHTLSIGATDGRVAAACYRSDHSVLIGPPTSSGSQRTVTGWLALELPRQADSGWAVLADSGSKRFEAHWRRDATDSVSLRASDDFLRVQMRLAISDTLVVGSARASSDAELERDASGRLADLQREWTLRAVRTSCDSMPPAPDTPSP
jgi:hypothetical protein